ncbi:MAG TPA: hypothetical protein VKT27_03050 [Candidatus Binataceae bacterium]|nr:hypothetical protein [Candidatus Binataceae bacterium]
MQTAMNTESKASERPGVVYRTVCQNPGCGATFDLRITPENASLLSGTMPCPRCRRRGGMLKPQGRLGHKLFAAKLLYRATGVAPTRAEDEGPLFGEEQPY